MDGKVAVPWGRIHCFVLPQTNDRKRMMVLPTILGIVTVLIFSRHLLCVQKYHYHIVRPQMAKTPNNPAPPVEVVYRGDILMSWSGREERVTSNQQVGCMRSGDHSHVQGHCHSYFRGPDGSFRPIAHEYFRSKHMLLGRKHNITGERSYVNLGRLYTGPKLP